MSRVASFNRLAEVELREAILYYESEAPGLGRRFLTTVESALAEILDHPLTGAPLRGDVRRKQLGRFPYHRCIAWMTRRFASLRSCTSAGDRCTGPNAAE